MSDQSLTDRIDVVELLQGLDYGELFEGTSLESFATGEGDDDLDGGVGETVGARLGELLGGLLGALLGRTIGTTVLKQLLNVGGSDDGE
ncbi:hypothetical protein [Halomarina oriensis]|uniref:Uncharacterized protein n=1 Tax=Halomarina oriensis TaxID=671145 RepID=A0A6B0GPU4_9EURY|nr:hypothetical protein [Halomarina oriensis]MWG34683.1 hypothetical protein [Halomarina oriensis]